MKLLTATSQTQGQRDSDFTFCIEGELVTPERIICDRDKEEGPDAGCGCGRSFVGLNSGAGTTTAMVRQVDGFTFDDLAEAVRSCREQAGYGTKRAAAEATRIADIAARYADGTIIELRMTEIGVRTT